MSGAQKIQVRVCAITPLNALVTRFCLEKYDGGVLPTFSGGAHTVVEMNDDGRRRLNAYSLMSDPFDTRVWCISVRRDDEGRGGSLYMHRAVQVGDELTVCAPVNLFALDLRAKKHLLIAGGIGITPFLAQIRQLEYLQGHWELHYACRSHALASYADDLLARYPSKVQCYYNDQSQAIDFKALLTGQPLGTHLYVCGPKGMIDLVRRQAEATGWPQGTIHSEEFSAPQPGRAFTVYLAASQCELEVGENESLLEAMERAGLNPPYLCRGGACGQCETDVLDYDGQLLHNDHWLTHEDLNRKIMPCVSRFEGTRLVLDR